MATATETSSRRDVKKLTIAFKNLGSSSPGTKEPFNSRSGSSDGKGYTASGASGPYRDMPELKPYFEVNHKQTATGPTIGLFCSYRDLPEVKPYFKKHKQTVTGTPMGLRGPVAGEGSYRDMSQFKVPHNKGSDVDCTYIPVDSSMPNFVGPVAGKGVDKDERPCVPCRECNKEHPAHSPCSYVPCKVCYQLHQPTYDCPYFYHIPQGADFDQAKYEIVCECGNLFNVDKWVCTSCTGRSPQLKAKYCNVCFGYKPRHCSHECPKDKVGAAEFKAIRDHYLSVGEVPDMYLKACSVSTSSGESVH